MPSTRTTTALAALALALSASATPIAPKTTTAAARLGHWQALNPIALQPRQEHTAVALNATTFALVGGIIPAPGGGGGGGNSPSDWATTDMFQLYNVETARWTLGPTLPFAVNHANTVVVGDSLYFLGGLVPDPDGNWVASGASHVLHNISSLPASAAADGPQWQPLAPAPAGAARGSAAVAAHGGRLYLAGGMLRLIPQDTIDSVVAYDVAADAWVPSASLPPLAATMPEARDHAGSAVVDGTLYVLGGRRWGQNNVRDTVFALDLSDLAAGWAVRPSRMPTARGGVAAAAIGSKIYTFGGEGNPTNGSAGVFADTEAYDVRADAWERLAPMEVPRHGSWAVSMPDGGVYVPGGGIRQGGAAVERCDVFWPPKC
ncbi:hypothetical protein RB595_003533 [Gaeumannomyces hyphopodioides]